MKKHLKLSRSLTWALLTVIALQAPTSIMAMEEEQQALTPQKQNLVQRLAADYKETWQLYKQRKAGGTLSPEEQKKLEERMKFIRKATITAGVIAAFIAVLYGGRYLYKRHDRSPHFEGREIKDWPNIYRAAFKGNVDILQQELLKPETNVETGDTNWIFYPGSNLYKETLLHLAVKGNKPKAVQYLLEHQANTEALDRRDFTPLLQATAQGNTEIVQLLLMHGANVNAQPSWTPGHRYITALHMAAVKGYPDIVQLLLAYGADPLTQDTMYGTPLDPIHPARADLPPVDSRRAAQIRGMIQDAINKRTRHAIWAIQQAGQAATKQPMPTGAIRAIIRAERGQPIEQEGVPSSERTIE